MRKCDVGSGLLHGDSGNCMDEGKYDGADFTVGFGWYDAARVDTLVVASCVGVVLMLVGIIVSKIWRLKGREKNNS